MYINYTWSFSLFVRHCFFFIYKKKDNGFQVEHKNQLTCLLFWWWMHLLNVRIKFITNKTLFGEIIWQLIGEHTI